jgi:hypothetical protein
VSVKFTDDGEEIVREGDPTTVRWNSDGSYTPKCPLCDYDGTTQWVHAIAVNTARTHTTGARHQHKLKQSGTTTAAT